MEEDFISENIINGDSISIFKKLYHAAIVFLILTLIYVLLQLWEMFKMVSFSAFSPIHGSRFIYFYRIYPIAGFIVLLLELTSSIYLSKAYRYLAAAAENNGSVLIEKPFKVIYTSLVLTIIAFSVAILSIACRITMV